MIRRQRITGDIEKKIVTACVVSDGFLRQASKIVKSHMLKIEFAKIVVEWCFAYYRDFSKAPQKTIQDIFLIKKEEIDSSVAKTISVFLQKLSEEYENSGGLNVEYLVKQTREYMDVCIHEELFNKGHALLLNNKLSKAKKLIREYKSIAKDVSDSINPFDLSEIRSFAQEDEENTLFCFDGAIGELIGPLKRGWFVGVMGPSKRGKSFWLAEFGIQGIFNRYKVLYVSFEMSKLDLKERFYTRLTGLPLTPQNVVYPIMDCRKNQYGTCNKKAIYMPERAKEPILIEDIGEEKPEYFEKNKYRVCTYCRDNQKRGYVADYWFTNKNYTNRILNTKTIENKLKVIRRRFGDNLRFKIWPSGTASMEDVVEHMEYLESEENFVTDILITDYADRMKPDSDLLGNEERSAINNIWMAHKTVAEEKHCLVVTGTHSGRKSMDAEHVKATDASGDIRKMAHVNVMGVLSQTEDEKDKGIMRFGLAEHRHKKFLESKQVTVLECRELGQPLLDSEWIKPEKVEKQKRKKNSRY